MPSPPRTRRFAARRGLTGAAAVLAVAGCCASAAAGPGKALAVHQAGRPAATHHDAAAPVAHRTTSEAPPVGPGAPRAHHDQQASTFPHVAVAAAPTPDGRGFWTAWADGTVTTSGSAASYGDMAGRALNGPLAGIAPTVSGKGYWLLGSDGGVFSFGDARFDGSTGGMHMNAAALQMTANASDGGYYFVAGDGGIFSFGGAPFFGSTGGMRLTRPVVGMAATRDGGGYWLVAADGGIFAFGDAGFHGSTGGMALNQPIVAMAPTATGKGYWMVAADGGIFAFGDAGFHGSAVGHTGGSRVVGIVATGDGGGYWIVLSDGAVLNYGDAPAVASPAPPSTGATGGSSSDYTFEVTNAAGAPARWNSCEVIHYSVVTPGAPAGWGPDVDSAIRQLSAATGLSFVEDGVYASNAQVPASTKITISWAAALNGGDEVGLTTYYYINDSRYAPQMTAATVQLLDRLTAGIGSGGELPVLLHELGHAVGLGHTPTAEVMNPVDQGFSAYRAGDLAGLSQLGASAGCAGFYS